MVSPDKIPERIHIYSEGREVKFDQVDMKKKDLHGRNGYIKTRTGGWRTVTIKDSAGKEYTVDKGSLIDFLISKNKTTIDSKKMSKAWMVGTSNANVAKAFEEFKESVSKTANAPDSDNTSGNDATKKKEAVVGDTIEEVRSQLAKTITEEERVLVETMTDDKKVFDLVEAHMHSFDVDAAIAKALAALEQKGVKRLGQGEFVRKFVEAEYSLHQVLSVALLQPLADKGNAMAQIWVGHAYKKGEGVEKNLDEAIRYYQLASRQGVAAAYIHLGDISCYTGETTGKKIEEAIRLYGIAKEKGHPKAQAALNGALERLYKYAGDYAAKDGHYIVKPDNKESVRLYEICLKFKHGSPRPLARMYQNGQGTKKNVRKAIKLYEQAIQQGDNRARIDLGHVYETGDQVKKDLKRAAELYTLAFENGGTEALLDLVRLHEAGMPLTQLLIDAIDQETRQRTAVGQVLVGDVHRLGLGMEKDEAEAVKRYQLIAGPPGIPHPDAEYKLGYMYEHGLGGLGKDPAQARRLYQGAANKMSWEAEQALKRLGGAGTG